jgi:hypothetical protein
MVNAVPGRRILYVCSPDDEKQSAFRDRGYFTYSVIRMQKTT